MCILAFYRHECKKCGHVFYRGHDDHITSLDDILPACPKCGNIDLKTRLAKPEELTFDNLHSKK